VAFYTPSRSSAYYRWRLLKLIKCEYDLTRFRVPDVAYQTCDGAELRGYKRKNVCLSSNCQVLNLGQQVTLEKIFMTFLKSLHADIKEYLQTARDSFLRPYHFTEFHHLSTNLKVNIQC
jgi:hypothetical protein